MKRILLLVAIVFNHVGASQAQIQTIIVNSSAAGSHVTNSLGAYFAGGTLQISTNSSATLKSVVLAVNQPAWTQLLITTQGSSVLCQPWAASNGGGIAMQPLVVSGPATIQLYQVDTGSNFPALFATSLATFDIQPSPFPPNKAQILGPNSGNVQVTMQVSTDLVNWTTASNAQVYTNSPDARFFRIQLTPNVGP